MTIKLRIIISFSFIVMVGNNNTNKRMNYLLANMALNSSSTPFNVCCSSLRMLAASDSS